MFFPDFRIVTFSNMMEYRGRVERKIRYLLEKIERDLRREGSRKEGEAVGLASKYSSAIVEVLGRAGGILQREGKRILQGGGGEGITKRRRGQWERTR